MNPPTEQPIRDPGTWPVVECEPADVFLGTFDYDCNPGLTAEQREWTATECEPADGRGTPGQPTPSA